MDVMMGSYESDDGALGVCLILLSLVFGTGRGDFLFF